MLVSGAEKDFISPGSNSSVQFAVMHLEKAKICLFYSSAKTIRHFCFGKITSFISRTILESYSQTNFHEYAEHDKDFHSLL